jgi:hypothetical protein
VKQNNLIYQKNFFLIVGSLKYAFYSLLRYALLSGEWLYKGLSFNISEAEKRDMELQKETLNIAKKVIQERKTKGGLDTYLMPESYDDATEKRLAVLKQKWKESSTSGVSAPSFLSEQTILEADRGVGATVPTIFKEKQALANTGKMYGFMDDSGAEIEFEEGDLLAEQLIKESDSVYNMSQSERDEKALVKRFSLKWLLIIFTTLFVFLGKA